MKVKKIFLPMVIFIQSLILLNLAWRGLHLPFDFQPDPNFSHVLYGFYLTSGGAYSNFLYPGVPTFYLYALANKIFHLPALASMNFNLSTVITGTYIARTMQFLLTAIMNAIWIVAFAYLIDTYECCKKRILPETNKAYYFSILIMSLLTTCNYGTVYASYFLRPDNTLSALLACGIILSCYIYKKIILDNKISYRCLMVLGIWMFFTTITKNQAQPFILLLNIFGLALFICKKPFFVASKKNQYMNLFIYGIFYVLVFFLYKKTLYHSDTETKYFAIFIFSFPLIVVILKLLLPNKKLITWIFYVLSGWLISFTLFALIISPTTPLYSSIKICNPMQALAAMFKEHLFNDSISNTFHFYAHYFLHTTPCSLLIPISALFFIERQDRIITQIILILGVGMLILTGLRSAAYYNIVLFYPFFSLAFGFIAYCLLTDPRLSKKFTRNEIFLVLLLFALYDVNQNINLHNKHMNDYKLVCNLRHSLQTVHYFPDVINIEYTLSKTGWIDYSSHYFSVISTFYSPKIHQALQMDQQFTDLIQGKLVTCDGK